MFTATKDVVLPTTVTGSWPRPRWFDARLAGRPLSTCMKDVVFREQLTDALSTLLTDQERAGLDVLTHGDYFHDEDIGGHAWHRYPLERWSGLVADREVDDELAAEFGASFAPGTILHEVFGAWRWPRAVGKVERNQDNPLEYAKIWRLAQGRTDRPVKFGTVCAQGIHHFVSIDTPDYLGDDRRQLIWDMATAMNAELRELAAAGCRVIQVEEPLIHFLACYKPEQAELIDFLVEAFNHEVEGLDDVEVWVHTCWGNPNMQRVHDNPSYAASFETYLERLNADVWTIELADGDRTVLDLFAPYKDRLSKKIAIGVVSHRNLQVERADEVAELTRAALRTIGPENLILSSDCGFGRQGANRAIAFYKAVAIVQGANIVRRELGLEERYVPAADPRFQADLLGERRSALSTA
jgi:5-methyltetrahydropteroyltriglutamate--homocysteine methyltransferase